MGVRIVVLTPSQRTYLKTIYVQTRSGQPTLTVALAAALHVRPVSVTGMLRKLANGENGRSPTLIMLATVFVAASFPPVFVSYAAAGAVVGVMLVGYSLLWWSPGCCRRRC
jgi:hypothetical protein